MRKFFAPILVLTAVMFAYSPIAIANAPYESTMLLVQKIFYYHFPTWIALTLGNEATTFCCSGTSCSGGTWIVAT